MKKYRSVNSEKNWNFPKGVSLDEKKYRFVNGCERLIYTLCKNWKILKLFLFEQSKSRKGVLLCSRWEKCQFVIKAKKIEILQKGLAHGCCQQLKIVKLFLF